MQEEIWAVVDCYNERYQVSNFGRVRSVDMLISNRYGTLTRKKGRILKDGICGSGYRGVSLSIDGKSHTNYVHRLVAQAFIENPKNKPEVNHIDGNKENNHASNLEWVTHKENFFHAIKNDLTNKGSRNGRSKLTKEDVLEIKKRYQKGETQRSISKDYSVHFGTISDILKGKSWSWVQCKDTKF